MFVFGCKDDLLDAVAPIATACGCEDDFFDDADADAPIATAGGNFFVVVFVFGCKDDLLLDADAANETFFANGFFFDLLDADADAEGLFAANAVWLVAGIFLP